MPITFSSLDELKAFCDSFSLVQYSTPLDETHQITVPNRRSRTVKRSLRKGALAEKIQQVVEQLLEQGEPFCAQTIAQQVRHQVPFSSEASVLASISVVLKKHYAHLPTELEHGKAPRASRFYLSLKKPLPV